MRRPTRAGFPGKTEAAGSAQGSDKRHQPPSLARRSWCATIARIVGFGLALIMLAAVLNLGPMFFAMERFRIDGDTRPMVAAWRARANSTAGKVVNLELERPRPELRLWRVRHFLSETEAEHLREAYAPFLYSCKGLLSAFRECHELQVSMRGYARADDAVPPRDYLLAEIERRLAGLIGHHCSSEHFCRPADDPDSMHWQIVRYRPGGAFPPHDDQDDDGPMPLTAMIYLNNMSLPEEAGAPAPALPSVGWEPLRGVLGELYAAGGGQTAFPFARHVVAPEQGMLLLWANCDATGRLERRAHHGGVPVARGEKWILNMFLTNRRIPLSECANLAPRTSIATEYLL